MSALPLWASCGASCQHIDRCRVEHGLKGSENVCVYSPSQFTPNVQLMPHATENCLVNVEPDGPACEGTGMMMTVEHAQ